jgi:hypothetical protein
MDINIDTVLGDLEVLTKVVSEAYVIRFNGKTVQLYSGKSLWKKRNHASSALVNHCEAAYGTFRYYKKSLAEEMGFKDGKEIAHYLLEKEILKIEKL